MSVPHLASVDGARAVGRPTRPAQRVKLSASGVTIHYKAGRSGRPFLAVDGVDLDIRDGELVTIVGPSGCGKTSFLNAVDGLLPISGGELALDGRPITKPGPDRAMVFQQPSLLPWRTVLGNVAYGLEIQGQMCKSEARQHARGYVELVGLRGFEDSYASQLSGGMQQRVNLARALAIDPDMLLLDEPFAALDAQTRELMQAELLRVWAQSRKTALFITHDIKEAIYLADRVVVFTARPGRIKRVIEIDLPRPRTLHVKREPKFLAYEDEIWALIEEEVNRASGREAAAGGNGRDA